MITYGILLWLSDRALKAELESAHVAPDLKADDARVSSKNDGDEDSKAPTVKQEKNDDDVAVDLFDEYVPTFCYVPRNIVELACAQ